MNGKLTLVLFAALVAVASAGNFGSSYRRPHGIGSHRNIGVRPFRNQGFRNQGFRSQQHYRPTSYYQSRHRRSASGLNYGSHRGSTYTGQNYYNPGSSYHQSNSYRRPLYSSQRYNRQYYQH